MANDVLPKKRITVDLMLALVFFAVFPVILVVNILLVNLLYFRCIHFFLLALFLVPSGSFCFFWRYQRKHAVSKTRRIVIRTISIVISVALLLFSSGKILFNEIFVPVQDPIYYQHLLKMHDYPENEQMAHFPKAVPADARDVRLYEQPAFLQGGDCFTLKYDTTPNEIDQIIMEYRGKAKAVVDMGEYNNAQCGLAPGICLPDFFIEMTGFDSNQLPDDFELFILDSETDGTSWNNHGLSIGIAISTQRREVIYFFEQW